MIDKPFYDRITLKAAELFNIAPEDVSPEQRQVTKLRMHIENYSMGTAKLTKQKEQS